MIRKKVNKNLKKLKNTFIRELSSWKKSYQPRRDYSSRVRHPFYKLAEQYLPDDDEAVILDIGAGEGLFGEYLEDRFNNFYLLDANPVTIESLKSRFENVILYTAPSKLPFEDCRVSYIHCSHLVEHLYYSELYAFLKEIDRVLKKEGILVISTPLLWTNFYHNLSHVKPYNPNVFITYLCRKSKQGFADSISESYSILEEVYRYTTVDFGEWGSDYMLVDFLIQFSKRIFSIFKIKKYTRNAYTLVLRKS